MCAIFVHCPDVKECNSACDKTKEVVVELFEYKRKRVVLKDRIRILSVKVPLEEDELYTEKTYTGE